jgi:prophage regulatory protein
MDVLDLEGLRQRGIRYSPTQLWRLVRAGTFPRPIKIGGGRNAWLATEVDEYIKSRVAARDAAVAP